MSDESATFPRRFTVSDTSAGDSTKRYPCINVGGPVLRKLGVEAGDRLVADVIGGVLVAVPDCQHSHLERQGDGYRCVECGTRMEADATDAPDLREALSFLAAAETETDPRRARAEAAAEDSEQTGLAELFDSVDGSDERAELTPSGNEWYTGD